MDGVTDGREEIKKGGSGEPTRKGKFITSGVLRESFQCPVSTRTLNTSDGGRGCWVHVGVETILFGDLTNYERSQKRPPIRRCRPLPEADEGECLFNFPSAAHVSSVPLSLRSRSPFHGLRKIVGREDL